MNPKNPRNTARPALLPSVVLLAGLAALSAGCGQAEGQGIAQQAVLAGPSLGTAQTFAVLGGSTVTSTGPTTIVGDLGVSPGLAITGFPPGLVSGGVVHAGDAVAAQAQHDLATAYGALASDACDTDLTGQNLGGLTLTPGVYCFSSSAQLTGTLTLDAQNDPDAVFIFQIASTLTTADGASVLAVDGAQACNAFWQIGSSATLGTGTLFTGNVLALASITLATGAGVTGRALAQTGAVTMDQNQVDAASCAAPPDAGAGCIPVDSMSGSHLWIMGTSKRPSTAKVHLGDFSLALGLVNGVPGGQLDYDDAAAGVHVAATDVTSYVVTGPTSRVVQGDATVNGVSGLTFTLGLTIDGNDDIFTIALSNGYHAAGLVMGGSLELLVKACP